MSDLLEHAKKRVKNNKAHQYLVSAEEYEGLVGIIEQQQSRIVELEQREAELIEQVNSLQSASGRQADRHVEEKKELKQQRDELAATAERLLVFDMTPDEYHRLVSSERYKQNIDSLKREVAGEAFLKGAEWMAQCELDDTLHLDENQAAFDYAAKYPIGKECL